MMFNMCGKVATAIGGSPYLPPTALFIPFIREREEIMKRINPTSVSTWISNNGVPGRDYRRFCKIDGKDYKFSHLVWNWYNPRDQINSGDGYHIYHRDGNTLNDDPTNLEKMTSSSHTILHNTGRVFTEERCRNISKSLTGKKDTEETRRKKSEAHKGEKNYNFGIPMKNSTRIKLSRIQKERYKSDPDLRSRISEIRKKWWEELKANPIVYKKYREKRRHLFLGMNNPNASWRKRKIKVRIVVKPQ